MEDFTQVFGVYPDDSSYLKVSGTKKFSEFTLDELSHLAVKAMLPAKLVLDTARETVSAFHEILSREKTNLSLTKHMIGVIEKHIQNVPLADTGV